MKQTAFPALLPALTNHDTTSHKGNLFLLKINGTSMTDADIKNGDYGVFRKTDTLIDGAIMAVKHHGHSFIKHIKIHKQNVRLCWQDGSGTSLLTPIRNIEPQGELVSIIKVFAHDEFERLINH